jgi:hypothetical protein
MLAIVALRNAYRHGKFLAYYRLCRGPSFSQISALQEIEFEILEYVGFVGHSGYYNRIPYARFLHHLKTALLLRHPISTSPSYAPVVLKKRLT